jgi:hypothetical protein
MNTRTATLKQLVEQSSYPVDEAAIAEAIIVRCKARQMLPEVTFRQSPPKPVVRSFRPHRGARSFRLARSERRAPDGHVSAAGSARVLALR